MTSAARRIARWAPRHLALANCSPASILNSVFRMGAGRYGECSGFLDANSLRPYLAPRSVVDDPGRSVHGPLRLRRLRNLGRPSGQALRRWAVPLSVLHARAFRRLDPQPVWAQARRVAELAHLFASADHPAHPRALSIDL